MVYTIRKAGVKDLDFIVRIDLEGEGVPGTLEAEKMSSAKLREHRLKMRRFVTPVRDSGDNEYESCPKMAYIAVDKDTGESIGLIMFLFRDMNSPDFKPFDIFDKFDRSLFPKDGRFCEIYELWTAPSQRRRGIATRLKQKAESAARRHQITMMYTHTAVENTHVVELNLKLGYHVIRTGPLWDKFVRVSLVKYL